MEYTVTNKLSGSSYDTIELMIRKESTAAKVEIGPKFIGELNRILNYCMLLPKAKKEAGVIKEKLFKEILQIFQSQKQFKNTENIFSNMRYLAVYDNETNEVGKIKSIDPVNLTVTFFTYIDALNHRPLRTKAWKELKIFDYNSLSQMEVIQRTYIDNNQRGLTYLENYTFLSGTSFQTKSEINVDLDLNKGYGIELAKAETHEMIKEVMHDYKIPEHIISKPKKRLQKLCTETMAIIEEYDSITQAESLTKVSASTISNVLCAGGSATHYTEAGGYRWQWSNKPNYKYLPE